MAISIASRTLVDVSVYEWRVLDVEPKMEFNSEIQKHNLVGVLLWKLTVQRHDGERREFLEVTVASRVEPTCGEVTFERLTMNYSAPRGQEWSGIYWAADSLEIVE